MLILPNKFLIVLNGRIGDTIFCTPMIRLLKQTFPACQIDILSTTKDAQTVLQKNPYINNLYLNPDKLALQKLAAADYDNILLPYEHYGALDLALSLNKSFIAVPEEYMQNMHMTERFVKYYADLWKINLDGFDYAYDMRIDKKDHDNILRLLKKYDLDPKQNILIGFHLGCHRLAFLEKRFWHKTYHKKIWPWKHFVKLARKLTTKYPNARIIITGAGQEKIMAEKFLRKYKHAVSFIDQTTLPELLALMSYLELYVTCDSAPLHLACIAKVNIIALFGGETHAYKTGPFPPAKNHVVIQKDKIKNISVAEVFKACLTFLA